MSFVAATSSIANNWNLASAEVFSAATSAIGMQNVTEVSSLVSSVYQQKVPPICTQSPRIPIFPLPASHPSLIPHCDALISDVSCRAMSYPFQISIVDAIKENNIPILRYWLEQDDLNLMHQLGPSFGAQSPAWFYRNKFEPYIEKAVTEGNIAIALLLLDRINQGGNPHPLNQLLGDVFTQAVKEGQSDLIFAILRRNYPIDNYQKSELFAKAIRENPTIATKLLSEDLPVAALQKGFHAAIEMNHKELLSAFLEHYKIAELTPAALRKAAQENRLALIKELFKQAIPEDAAFAGLFEASAMNNKEAAHFIASQGVFYLNDRHIVSYLVKTGFLPYRFKRLQIPNCSLKQKANLIAGYLESGKITDQEIQQKWDQLKDVKDRFVVFRAILAYRNDCTAKLQEFLFNQFVIFTPKEQELFIRIAIHSGHSPKFVTSLIEKMNLLNESQKKSLLELQTERSLRLDKITKIQESIAGNKLPSPPSWDQEKVRENAMKHSSEIFEFIAAWKNPEMYGETNKDPRFKFYFSGDIIGEIRSMPNLILKSFRSPEDAEKRFALMDRVRSVCKEKNLTHIRIPNALLIGNLSDSSGEMKPVNLIIEEKLPVLSHSMLEIKQMIDMLNKNEESSDRLNQYFQELTALVCKTGVTDLKPTNVPLLKDGSGLALVDSSIQYSSPLTAIYNYEQMDHSLIDWVSPINLQAIGHTLDTHPDCPNIKNERRVHEIAHEKRYLMEQQTAKIHLEEYGNLLSAPITLSKEDLSELDPNKRAMCVALVQKLNRNLESFVSEISPRRTLCKYWEIPEWRTIEALYKGSDARTGLQEIFQHLIYKRKIFSVKDYGGHGYIVQC